MHTSFENKQMDRQFEKTDRQMVLLLGQAGFDEMDKRTIRPADRRTDRNSTGMPLMGRQKIEQA